jgi:hypothetical protein
MRYYKNALAKGSHITIKLPKDGQTTKKKYACKMLLVRKCGLHPLIHTSAPSESSTKCGSGFSRGKVWIKVCNVTNPVVRYEFVLLDQELVSSSPHFESTLPLLLLFSL